MMKKYEHNEETEAPAPSKPPIKTGVSFKYPQVLFHWAVFQLLCTQPAVLPGDLRQVQDPALHLVEASTHQSSLCGAFLFSDINTPAQLGVICKLTWDELNSLI